MAPRFLVIDGYPEQSRHELEAAGMQLAWQLYERMIRRFVPEAAFDLWLPADTAALPAGGLDGYAGLLWTGCNLTVYHTHDERVTRQIELAREAYRQGIPSFGTCWGLQIGVVAAGGEVAPNPKGREMGLARKLRLTPAGASHPFMAGKPAVYEAFISHEDMVTRLPPGALHLAGNDFCPIQAAAITHERGSFWALQYHPEYDLREMACLIVAREAKLVKGGFYRGHQDLAQHTDELKALAADPTRADLRWRLAIDDDVLDADLRQREVGNWLRAQVLG